MLAVNLRAIGQAIAERGKGMRTKVVAIAVILGLAVVSAVALRTTNRAEAAAGNCYSETQGPSTPTICS